MTLAGQLVEGSDSSWRVGRGCDVSWTVGRGK